MTRLIDLHLHSTASDGTDTPEEIAKLAASLGLSAAAITDHDTIDSLDRFIAATTDYGIEAVTGVEIEVLNEPVRGLQEVHILGYLFDHHEPMLVKAMEMLQESKVEWGRRFIERLRDVGLAIDLRAVQAEAAPSVPRRPHFWSVLDRSDAEISMQEFYVRSSHGGDLYVTKPFEVTLDKAVALITGAGGVPVLAHPGIYSGDQEGIIDVCQQAGVVGLEVIYPYSLNRPGFNMEREQRLISGFHHSAEVRGLLKTGGSDYHGDNKRVALGQLDVPGRYLQGLRRFLP